MLWLRSLIVCILLYIDQIQTLFVEVSDEMDIVANFKERNKKWIVKYSNCVIDEDFGIVKCYTESFVLI